MVGGEVISLHNGSGRLVCFVVGWVFVESDWNWNRN